jgi:SOS-response transcriptional repressor LexA
MKKIHPIQKSILQIAEKYDLKQMSLGKISRLVGESYAQTAKHHISQLKKKRLLDENLKLIHSNLDFLREGSNKLISIPIIGAANCGEASLIAEENIEGFLKVSPRIAKNRDRLFVLRADGDSMNNADVYGQKIEDGDYVLIDGRSKDFQSGEYVVSIIDGMGNIKKFIQDKNNHQIILVSESKDKKKYPPIYIHEDDFSTYRIAGKVIQVLKPSKVEDIRYEEFKN